MIFKYIYFFLFFIFTFVSNGYTQLPNYIIKLKHKNDLLLVGKMLHYLEDKNASWSFQDVQKADLEQKFKLFNKDVFARPASSSSFWFRIDVQNYTEEDVWLEIGSIMAWYVDFYAPDENGKYNKVIQTGIMRPYQTRLRDVNLIWLPLNKAKEKQTKTFYIRIQTKRVYELPFQIGTLESLYKNKTLNDFLVAGFVGITLIMLLYNAFLYISVKEQVYLYYVGYLFFAIITTTFLHNYPIIDNAWWHSNYVVWASPFYLFVGLFSIEYLDLRNKLYYIFILILIELCLLSFLLPLLKLLQFSFFNVATTSQLLAFLYFFTCLLGSYYLLLKGEKKARFYALAWTFLIISIFVFLGVLNGIFTFNPYTRNAILLGGALEYWLFSLALADKMNIVKREKEQAQFEILNLVREQKEVLEIKVAERTAELRQTNEELNITLETVAYQRDNILSSIHYARKIQNAFLPSFEKIKQYIPNLLLFYKPKDIVSGDFYWFTQKDDYIFLVVADCTGHGVPGAFMTVVGEVLLDQIINKDAILSPANILTELDKRLLINLQQTHQDREKIEDGMDISLLRFSKNFSDITWAGAKRSLWVFEHQQNEPTIHKGDKFPIGSNQYKDKFFTEKHLILQKNETIYTFTDGYADQFGKEGKFTIKKKKELIVQNFQRSFVEQQVILTKTLEEWQGKEPQTDDILIVGVKI